MNNLRYPIIFYVERYQQDLICYVVLSHNITFNNAWDMELVVRSRVGRSSTLVTILPPTPSLVMAIGQMYSHSTNAAVVLSTVLLNISELYEHEPSNIVHSKNICLNTLLSYVRYTYTGSRTFSIISSKTNVFIIKNKNVTSHYIKGVLLV